MELEALSEGGHDMVIMVYTLHLYTDSSILRACFDVAAGRRDSVVRRIKEGDNNCCCVHGHSL